RINPSGEKKIVVRIDDGELLKLCKSKPSDSRGSDGKIHLILRKAFVYPDRDVQRAQQLQRLQEIMDQSAGGAGAAGASGAGGVTSPKTPLQMDFIRVQKMGEQMVDANRNTGTMQYPNSRSRGSSKGAQGQGIPPPIGTGYGNYPPPPVSLPPAPPTPPKNYPIVSPSGGRGDSSYRGGNNNYRQGQGVAMAGQGGMQQGGQMGQSGYGGNEPSVRRNINGPAINRKNSTRPLDINVRRNERGSIEKFGGSRMSRYPGGDGGGGDSGSDKYRDRESLYTAASSPGTPGFGGGVGSPAGEGGDASSPMSISAKQKRRTKYVSFFERPPEEEMAKELVRYFPQIKDLSPSSDTFPDVGAAAGAAAGEEAQQQGQGGLAPPTAGAGGRDSVVSIAVSFASDGPEEEGGGMGSFDNRMSAFGVGGLMRKVSIKNIENIVQENINNKNKRKTKAGWRESIMVRNRLSGIGGFGGVAVGTKPGKYPDEDGAAMTPGTAEKQLPPIVDESKEASARASTEELTDAEKALPEVKVTDEEAAGPIESVVKAVEDAVGAVAAAVGLTNEASTPETTTAPARLKTPTTPQRGELQPITTWTPGRMIGKGAFGQVFHALNIATGEFFAVKQVLFGPEQDVNRAKREDALKREIELLKELDHVNIVRYLGCEVKPDGLNVFLEYVSGGSIASCLSRVGKFEDDLTRIFTYQILNGMEYLHSKNIIHRDIKGGNILVNADGIAKISDFGTSKKNEYQMAYQRVTRMSMQGSIPWMAPEVARGKGYGAKVDIWSLGCLVLEMLTGFPPWHKVSGSVIYLLGTGKTPPIPDHISPMARAFLMSCFVVDPEKRQRALELLNHEFAVVDSLNFDFKAWVEELEARRMQADQDDSDDDSEEEGSDEEEEEEEEEEGSEEEEEGSDEEEEMDVDDGQMGEAVDLDEDEAYDEPYDVDMEVTDVVADESPAVNVASGVNTPVSAGAAGMGAPTNAET
ncbi:hypothetical protein HDU76_010905, partial [Blyttiomyces sp. JEL0837]